MKILKDLLIQNVLEQEVKKVSLGINWTLVESEIGCGLAQTPQRDHSCQAINLAGTYAKRNSLELANLIRSENPFEIAIGIAAVNSSYNKFGLTGKEENGLDIFAQQAQEITVVGRFPRLSERYRRVKVIEQEPQNGEYPEEMAKEILATSNYCILTSSTLVNGTAEKMISFANHSTLAMVGPGTPLCTNLFSMGINMLCGIIITDTKKAARIVEQGGTVRELRKVSRYVTLRSH